MEANVAFQLDILESAIHRAFPGPDIGAAADLGQRAVCGFFNVHERDCAFVHFRLGIDQLKDAFRACKRADKAVKELA
ncbi:hypothetical protein SDC9_120013 [bioreactor metagenome]|uniref:Uncharacterized protein n=1 Tax=bioreactor metagenome TaxID=1076179 RepID=A0A645C7A4_9ZZZZ